MTATYDMGIATNHQAWRAVHDAARDGLSRREISGRTGLAYGTVTQYLRQPRPASIERRLNRNHKGAVYCRCGRPMAYKSPAERQRGPMCLECANRRQSERFGVPGKVETLRAWALRHGRVPAIGEAHELVGGSRSTAGEMMLRAFGPDPRHGAQRRTHYRGWPDGAPDVPNDDGRAAMSESARAAWRRRRRDDRGRIR